MTTINKHKISLDKVAEYQGYNNWVEMCEEYIYSGMCPACCDEECEVEHDGHCEHDCPSIFIEAGIH